MEELKIVKDIFFFIGSVLGVFAFFSTAINPLLKDNQEKWEKITTIISDDYFQGLEALFSTRSVTNEQLSTLWLFLDEVREDKDYLHFKFPNKNVFNKHLSNFISLVEKFDKEITPPIWDDEFSRTNRNSYRLNKEYFRENFDHHEKETNEYLKHLNYASDLVIKMRIEFRSMQRIANLRFIEIPFKKLLIMQSINKLKGRL